MAICKGDTVRVRDHRDQVYIGEVLGTRCELGINFYTVHIENWVGDSGGQHNVAMPFHASRVEKL